MNRLWECVASSIDVAAQSSIEIGLTLVPFNVNNLKIYYPTIVFFKSVSKILFSDQALARQSIYRFSENRCMVTMPIESSSLRALCNLPSHCCLVFLQRSACVIECKRQTYMTLRDGMSFIVVACSWEEVSVVQLYLKSRRWFFSLVAETATSGALTVVTARAGGKETDHGYRQL
jgi:hypothetical protein